MNQSDLLPPVDASHDPPFFQLDWQKWERLTVAVFEREPDIATANGYGRSGQSQFGIDVVARLSGNGMEVASCKLTQAITAQNLVKWSNDFLKYWDGRWKAKSVRRFVLATTAVNVADREIQDQIEVERSRFKVLGIDYELWGPTQFTAKLRAQRAIVASYLPPWVDIICGPIGNAAPEQTGTANLINQAEVAQLNDLQHALSGQVAARADEALHDLRAGRYDGVRALINELRQAATWTQLASPIQAKLIRLEAALKLRTGDRNGAASLAAEARALEPASERRLEAQIALETIGVDAAIAELGDPISPQGQQLLVAFYLMKGEPARAGDILDLLQREFADAETQRLTALHRLAIGDRPGALEAVRRSEALASDWTAVMQAGIIVRYAHSLSPAVGVEWQFYPNPVERALVREDDASQALLEEAIVLADRMSQASDTTDIGQWKLAILANRRNQQDAATALARALLQRTPNDLTVIAWSVNRGLDIDLEPSIDALKAEYLAGASEMTVRLLGLLLINVERDGAAAFLNEHLDTQSIEARAEAERWIARLEGQPEKTSKDQQDDAFPIVLRSGREHGRWAEVARVAEERLRMDPPDIEGLGLAEVLAEHGQWDLLKPLTDRIILFDTAGAVRIAAYALFNSGEFEATLELLRTREALFGPALPDSLRQLKARALLMTGRAQQSFEEVQSLGNLQSSDVRLLAAEIRATIGDPRSGIPVVREALRTGELRGVRALQWSQLLQGEDRDLARDLWRTALRDANKGAAAVAMMEQAFRLGLDREAGDLMPEVHAYARAGGAGIFLANIDDLQEMMEGWREASEDIDRKYQNGELPLHLVVRSDEAQFLRVLVFRDPNDPRLGQCLIRSGARPTELRVDSKWVDIVLHLDVSSLLLADQVGLLDLVEATKAPVHVASNLPAVLHMMERGTQSHQPTQREAREAAWHAFADGTLHVSVTPGEAPQAIELSVSQGQPAPVGSLIRGLQSQGLLSQPQAAEALLQVSDPEMSILALDDVETIRVDVFTLLDLAGANLIPVLATRYRVETSPETREQLRREIELAAEQDRLAETVKRLRERVAGNITTGRFTLLDPAVRADASGSREDEKLGPLARSLAELLSAPAIDKGVVWIDDRMISSYSQTGSMPIVGIFEILQTLLFDGRINRSQYFEKLRALRALGACFVPFETEEITVPLLDASIAEGVLVEAPELAILRRNFGAAGRLEGRLQIALPGAANPEGRPDEAEYPKTIMRLLHNCLDAVWHHDPLDDERAYAQSDWLWFAIREVQLNRPIPGDDPRAARDFFEVVQIGHLVDKAIDVGGLNDERGSARESYLHWLWHRCIRPKAASDSTYLERIGEHLATFYRTLLDDSGRDHRAQERRVIVALIWRRLQRLPAPVREQVIGTGRLPEFANVRQSITLGRLRFETGAFWRAVRRAHRYGHSKLRTAHGRRVRMVRDGDGIQISGPGRYRFADKLNGVVAARPADLPALIDDYLDFIDLEMPLRPELRARALTLQADANGLAGLFAKLREGAPLRRYELLLEKLSSARQIDAELFYPATVGRMVTFSGLNNDTTFDVATTWDRVVRRVGPVRAFQRLGFLPVSFPQRIFAEIDDSQLDQLIRSSPSAVSVSHLIAEARRRGWEEARIAGLVDRLVTVIVDTGELQIQLLTWSERAFAKDPGFVALPSPARLALVWLHSGLILQQIVHARSKAAPLIEYFEANSPALSASELLGSMGAGEDAASPTKMSVQAILYHALGMIFGSADLSTDLPPETFDKLIVQLRSLVGEAVAPATQLLQRRQGMPDAMGSWLRAKPNGILDGDLDPEKIRDALIDASLESLEQAHADRSSWFNLGAICAMGLSAKQRARLFELLRAADLYDIAIHEGALQPLIWRNLFLAVLPEENDWVTQVLFSLAQQCRDRLGRVLDANGRAEQALNQLVDIAILVAARVDGDRAERLADIIVGLAVAWPQAAPPLRRIVDNLLSTTPARDGQALWRAHLQLGSMP